MPVTALIRDIISRTRLHGSLEWQKHLVTYGGLHNTQPRPWQIDKCLVNELSNSPKVREKLCSLPRVAMTKYDKWGG